MHRQSWILGMFSKWPEPGQVKSRLAAETSTEWAAAVARAFLLDLLERLNKLNVQRVLAYSPEIKKADFAALVQNRFSLVPQTDGDLGERLGAFLRDQFAQGAERVVLIGTDSPTLPLALLEQAFAHLAHADLVLGPATDGGYYLIGCKRFVPELFQGIAWSSEQVLWGTVHRIKKLGLSLALLPPWYDVDTLRDWWMLRGHLAAMRQAGVSVEVANIEKLENIDWQKYMN